MEVIASSNILQIVRRTLNAMDNRVADHGVRVAYIAYKMLQYSQETERRTFTNIIFAGLLHDVGAYKTDNIDHMSTFENQDTWPHSIYGYLFLKSFSYLEENADIVLYHHIPYCNYKKAPLNLPDLHYAGLLCLADKVDNMTVYGTCTVCKNHLEQNKNILYAAQWVNLFLQAEAEEHIIEKLKSGAYLKEFNTAVEQMHFTAQEKNSLLSMIAYEIDFRSEFMVLHTVTTVNVSRRLAELLQVEPAQQEKIYYGALLHDIGKIKTPTEILEKPGRLTDTEMQIMRQHVVATADILEGYIEEDIRNIACNHHERLDGKGYPRGLTGEQLTLSDCIVMVSDLVSALTRKSSYKEAFDKQTVCSILRQESDSGRICKKTSDMMINNFDDIMATAEEYGSRIFGIYAGLKQQYEALRKSLPENLAQHAKVS
ncbi:MAG: HD domain-containing protein [Oscillospiraceae bacterium]|nr:HD domain-containing protein [Oscillospiraceae bacterium]